MGLRKNIHSTLWFPNINVKGFFFRNSAGVLELLTESVPAVVVTLMLLLPSVKGMFSWPSALGIQYLGRERAVRMTVLQIVRHSPFSVYPVSPALLGFFMLNEDILHLKLSPGRELLPLR